MSAEKLKAVFGIGQTELQDADIADALNEFLVNMTANKALVKQGHPKEEGTHIDEASAMLRPGANHGF